MTDTARDAARSAASTAESGAVEARKKVAPIGLIGKGLLYASLGFITINVVVGSRDAGSASKSGAIERVAQAPFGKFLMIALAASLVALVIWKALEAIAGDPIDGDEPTDRAKNAVKAFLYAGTAATAVSVLVANWSSGSSGSGGSGGSGDSGGGQEKAAGVILDWPAGKYLVMLIGLAVIGYGGYQIYQHVINTEFMDRISDSAPPTIETIGRLGYAGRSVLMMSVGLFLFIAGLDHDADAAQGLSGILDDFSGNTWGQVALWIIAFGTFSYGVFTLAEAKFRRAY